MNLPSGVRIVIVALCAGAVAFLLRVLFALVKEAQIARREWKPERVRPVTHGAGRSRRREELIVADVETLKRRFALRAGRYWLLAVVIAMSGSELQWWR